VRGNPFARGTRGALLHHLVDLLEGETLGLGDQEVGVDEGAGAEAAPDEEDGGLQVAVLRADHVWGDDGDDLEECKLLREESGEGCLSTYGVPEPVGGGGQSNTTRADGQREDLADDDPGSRTPGRGEEEDEDGNEGDLGVDGGDVVGDGGSGGVGGGDVDQVSLVETNSDTNNGDEELADQHAQGAPDEKRSTTDPLNGVEGNRGGADVDEGENQGDQEGVGDGAGRLQERGRVVEDEVNTSPLLHHL
jgi:hypothetical protein